MFEREHLYAVPLGYFLCADETTLHQKISLATYAAELIRRTAYASQGSAVLALWREIAWESGTPRERFSIAAEDVLHAEEYLSDCLSRLAQT